MEKRDLYNEKRILTNKVIEKGQDVPQGFYYITVVVFIENDQHRFLLQKRVLEKDGKWATTGGHPISGQSSLEGIVTEIKEELGIDINQNQLTLFKSIKTNDDFVDLYYLRKNISIKDIAMQPDEVDSVKWFTRSEIEELISNGSFSDLHVDFYYECLKFLDS